MHATPLTPIGLFSKVHFHRSWIELNDASLAAGDLAGLRISVLKVSSCAPGRVAELLSRLHSDLADAFAGHPDRLADLFQRVVGHSDSDPHPQNRASRGVSRASASATQSLSAAASAAACGSSASGASSRSPKAESRSSLMGPR